MIVSIVPPSSLKVIELALVLNISTLAPAESFDLNSSDAPLCVNSLKKSVAEVSSCMMKIGLSPVICTVGPLLPDSSTNVKLAEPVSRFAADPNPIRDWVSAAPAPVESIDIVASEPVPLTVKSAALKDIVLAGLTDTEPSDSFTVSGGETGPDTHITISSSCRMLAKFPKCNCLSMHLGIAIGSALETLKSDSCRRYRLFPDQE